MILLELLNSTAINIPRAHKSQSSFYHWGKYRAYLAVPQKLGVMPSCWVGALFNSFEIQVNFEISGHQETRKSVRRVLLFCFLYRTMLNKTLKLPQCFQHSAYKIHYFFLGLITCWHYFLERGHRHKTSLLDITYAITGK
jgi:hypothetical protein